MNQEGDSIYDVIKGFHDLFKFVFVANCELDEESVTEEERKTLEELDGVEVLENLRDIVTELLNLKREMKKSDEAELLKRTKQLESLLQKLEGEVRNHISVKYTQVEHQLKLHIDSLQSRLDELEKKNQNLLKENETLKKQTSFKEIEHHRTFSNDYDARKRILDEKFNEELAKQIERKKNGARTVNENSKEDMKRNYEEKIYKLTEVAEKRQRILYKLENECTKLKSKLLEKNTYIDTLKSEYERVIKKTLVNHSYIKESKNSELENLLTALELKSAELLNLQQQMKSKVLGLSPNTSRKKKSESVRKSMEEYELLQKTEGAFRKDATQKSIKDDRSISTTKKRSVSTIKHIRSNSEYTRPSTSNSKKRPGS